VRGDTASPAPTDLESLACRWPPGDNACGPALGEAARAARRAVRPCGHGTLVASRGAATDHVRHARHHCTGKGAFTLMEAVMTVVGRVVALRRYPVKSMAGQELDGAEVSWHGLAGDRRWAFIRDGQVRSGFPWLTIRERPELAHYRPRFTDPDRPNASQTLVRTPSGSELDVADPALAAELGPGVRVIKQDRGIFDTLPLSLLTTQTLAGLGRLAGTHLVAARFRPNLLVDAGEHEFPEDAWVGRVLRIGGLRMRVDKRDQRCLIVTVDPVTLRRDPAILRAIARERDAQLGVYGSTVEPGKVTAGDPVELEP